MAIKFPTFLLGRGRLGGWTKALRGANSVVIIGLVAAVLIVVNALAAHREVRWDWSETHRFTLAPQTLDLLKQLDHEVTIYAFVQEASDEGRRGKDLLETYRAQSPKVRFHVLDPDQHPAQAKEFGVNQYGTVVVTTASGRQARGTAITESEVTGALLRALRERGQAVYFLEGHGEHELTDSGKEGYFQLRAILEQEGYTPKTGRLLSGEPIPADAATVVIAGPKIPLQPGEVESLKQYLERGGRLAVLADPQIDTGLEPLLAHWGITLGPGLVVDQEGRTFGGSYTLPLITIYSLHEIVRGLKLPTLFPEARPLYLDLKSPTAGLMSLAQTSSQSWAELDVQARPPQYDSNREKRGPFVLAVAAAPRNMLDDVKGSPRIIVVGDSDFLSNVYFNFSGNRDLFLNMLNWLMEGLDSFTIRPQPVNVSPIILSEQQARVLFAVPVVAVPLLITCAGWGIWRFRRMRV
jgi:ABC-type uncharacterized transport system involved in gliding motility auxiliary subunit